MNTALGAEQAVGVFTGGAEGCRLDAGLIAGTGRQQLDRKTTLLSPAHQHPQDHLGPVLGIGATGASDDRHERVTGVVVASKEPLLFECCQAPLNVAQLAVKLVGKRGVLLGQLQHRRQIVGVAGQLLPAFKPP